MSVWIAQLQGEFDLINMPNHVNASIKSAKSKFLINFQDCLLHPRYRFFRLAFFTALSLLIFVTLWSISSHPVSNNYVMTDKEVDELFRKCQSKPKNDGENVDPRLGIFIPFDLTQVNLIKSKLHLWLEPEYCPCKVINKTSRGIATASTDLIFFFIGDGNEHPQIYPLLLSSLSRDMENNQTNEKKIKTVISCFNAVVFRSLRDLEIPSKSTLTDLFYGIFKSNLLEEYSHLIWMDASVSPFRKGWLNAIFRQLYSEPFWILGAMTSSSKHDHFDRSHYHMHINAIYKLGDKCFNNFLKRVKKEFKDMTPDMAIHLFRTDFANFREAQHTQHLFRYTRLFVALDLPLSEMPTIRKEDWPGAHFVIQDGHWSRFGKNMAPIIAERDVQHINEDRENEKAQKEQNINPMDDDNEDAKNNQQKDKLIEEK